MGDGDRHELMLCQKPDMRHRRSMYLCTGECNNTAHFSVVSATGYEPHQNDRLRRDVV
jgi:hypothetical protein